MRALLLFLLGALVGAGVVLGGLFDFRAGATGDAPPRDHVGGAIAGTPEGSQPTSESAASPRAVPRETMLGADLGDTVVESPPTGTATLSGVLRNRERQPLEGVEIELQPSIEPEIGDAGGPSSVALASFKTRSDALARGLRRRIEARRSVKTGRDGRFEFTRLPEGRYDLAAAQDRLLVQAASGRSLNRLLVPTTVELVGLPLCTVRVSVVNADGAVPASSALSFRGEWSQQDWTWSADAPQIRLPIGPHEVVARAGDPAEWKSAATTFFLRPEHVEKGYDLSVKLERAVGICGRIVFSSPESAPDVMRVLVAQVEPGTQPSPDAFARNASTVHCREVEGFRFEIEPLAAGTYVIAAATMDSRILATDSVDVGRALTRKDLVITENDAQGQIIVRATDADGAAIRKLEATLKFQGPKGTSDLGPQLVAMQTDGSGWIRQPKVGLEAQGTYRILLTAFGLGTREATCESGPGASVDVRFEAPAQLHVSWTSAEGVVLPAGTTLSIGFEPRSGASTDSPQMLRHRKVASASGSTTFDPLQPGAYVVRMGRVNANYEPVTLAIARVQLTAGENNVRLEITPAYRLRVIGTPEMSGMLVLVKPSTETPGAAPRQSRLDSDGRVDVEDLPAGAYLLTVGRKNLQVQLTGNQEVRVSKEEKPNALLVTVVDQKGTLAAAGLETGDIIVGIDHERFKDLAAFSAAMAKRVGEPSVTRAEFLIHRNGREISVAVSREDLQKIDSGKGGGYFTPTEF